MPEPSKLLFLAHIAKDDSAKEKAYSEAMADVTLRRIWRGGIHDHLGGGVMRSAADERWIVPKFEEELSMQALMLLAVSLMEEISSNQFHRMFAEDIIFCAMKYFADDTAYSQAFRSAVDGDTDDGEGRYYTWSEDEIRRILPDTFAGIFCAAYGVLPSGNLKAEIAGSQMGQNILYEASTVTDLADRSGIKAEEVVLRLNECRKMLLEARDARNPLKTDSKILMHCRELQPPLSSRSGRTWPKGARCSSRRTFTTRPENGRECGLTARLMFMHRRKITRTFCGGLSSCTRQRSTLRRLRSSLTSGRNQHGLWPTR